MIIEAGYKDKKWISDLLSRSFDTNKSVNFVTRQGSGREKRIRRLMNYSFETCFSYGKVFFTDDKKACALILFPEKKKNNIKSLYLDLRLVISCIGLTRISKVTEREKVIKSNYPDTPILYLWFLGVETGEQGKGTGTELLRYIISESEKLQRPIYLETSMEVNIPFYLRQGFEIYKELTKPHPLFLLRRKPA